MTKKIVPPYVATDDVERAVEAAIKTYSEAHIEFSATSIMEISTIVSEYVFGLCDEIFEFLPGKTGLDLDRVVKAANKLNKILEPFDSVSLLQNKNDPAGDEYVNSVLSIWEKSQTINKSQGDYIKFAIANINRHLVRNYSDVEAGALGLGLALSAACEDEFSNAFGDLFIFNLRQMLAALTSFILIQTSSMESSRSNYGKMGAPLDERTSKFLMQLHDIYKRESGSSEIDAEYFSLLECLKEVVTRKMEDLYGSKNKLRINGMNSDSIRVSISRARKSCAGSRY